MSEIQRDLASTELWYESLERSRRRRALAPIARKREARKKRTSLVAGAAVATAPMFPALAAADAASSHGTRDHGKSRRLVDKTHERILLRRGDTTPAVGELQKALNIQVDDIFGPQTEAAVRDLQTRAKLPVTGKVDVRTWLTLFPTDAIISVTGPTAPGSSRNTPPTAQWAAVTVPPAKSAPEGKIHTASVGALATAAKGLGAPGSAATDVGNGSGGVSAAPQPSAGRHQATASPIEAPPRTPVPPAPTTVSVPGSTGGQAVQIDAPTPGSAQTAAELVAQMIAAADAIDAHHYAYRWGGGHNSSFSGPYDCSGAVSAVLHSAGLLSAPLVSGDFMHWGAPGPGTVTIYANASHVYMSIDGRFFGTSYANTAGGAGWFQGSARPGFVVVHVPFEQMHLRPTAARVQAARARRHQRRQATAVAAVQPRTGGGAVVTAAGGTAAPVAQPQPTAPAASAGAPATAAPSSGTPVAVAPSSTTEAEAPSPSAPATVAPTPAPETPAAAAPVATAPAPSSDTPATAAPTPAPEAPAAVVPVAATPAPAVVAPAPNTDTTPPATDVTSPPSGATDPEVAAADPSPPVTQAPASPSPAATAADPAPVSAPATPPASGESTTQGTEAPALPAAA